MFINFYWVIFTYCETDEAAQLLAVETSIHWPPVIGRSQRAGVYLQQSLGNRHTHKRPRPHILTPQDNLERLINLAVVFLNCGKNAEYPERTHSYRGRIGKESTQDLNPEPSSLRSCCKVTLLPTAPQCNKKENKKSYG